MVTIGSLFEIKIIINKIQR